MIAGRTTLCFLGVLTPMACYPELPSQAPEQARPKASAQQRSPVVEYTREHRRVKDDVPEGRREQLTVGTLFVPAKLKGAKDMPLLVHFHGGSRVPEVAAASVPVAVVSVQLGAGSSAYGKPFADERAFGKLLDEAEKKAETRFSGVTLSAWSAGYGAVRAILRAPGHYRRVDTVLLLDGLHAGYAKEPGDGDPSLVAEDLELFARFARDAVSGKKQLLVTHSEVFPGTFASTTETADYLLHELGLKRKPTLEWGPVGMQQLSEVAKGDFRLLGFAGNSAPDHVDHLHGLSQFLERVHWPARPKP